MTSMRRIITDTFDPRYAGKPSDSQFDRFTAPNPPDKPKPDFSDSNVVAPLDRERKEAERRIKELSEPQMQELKRAALAFFDVWRESVLGRVAEAVGGKDEERRGGRRMRVRMRMRM